MLYNLFRGRNLLTLGAIAVLILFYDVLYRFFNGVVVQLLLFEIGSHWSVDILFFLALLLFPAHLAYRIEKGRKFSNSVFLAILVCFILLLFYRQGGARYVFTSFYWLPKLKYADVFYVLVPFLVLFQLYSWLLMKEKPVTQHSPFITDIPIDEAGKDLFGRDKFARKIAGKIQSRPSQKDPGAIAVGISGKWGSGKTSFINLVKNSIDRRGRIVIHFNPWRSITPEKIVEDFFEQLISELRNDDPALSKSIASYARSLVKIHEDAVSKAAGSLMEIFLPDESKSRLYQSINQSIIQSGKQIVVFIDDLDRLEKKEIIEVLRIVRNTANFSGMAYVVSYDKDYVATAIKEFNEHNYGAFLEKIFQFEFILPLYDSGILKRELKKLLSAELSENLHTQIDYAVDNREHSGVSFTNELVKTYRDVIRLVNSVLFEIDSVREEILFEDFYLLQLLKLKFPKVYESISTHRQLFFSTSPEGLLELRRKDRPADGSEALSISAMFDLKDKNSTTTEPESDALNFGYYLEEKKEELELSNYDRQLILLLVETLLTVESGVFQKRSKHYKSFGYAVNFHKYFALDLFSGDISIYEFEKLRMQDFAVYREKVFQWIDQGKESTLLDRLERLKDFSKITEYENHVRIIMELGRYATRKDRNASMHFNFGMLMYAITYPKSTEAMKLYSNRAAYKNFINGLFSESRDIPLFESDFAARLIHEKPDNFVLTQSELSDINLKYFTDYCKTYPGITPEFRKLHINAIRRTDSFTQPVEVIPAARELFRSHYKKYLQATEMGSFIRQSSPGGKYFELQRSWFDEIFESDESFKLYLNNPGVNFNLDINSRNEFLSFYNKTKEFGWSAVEFSFNYLKPSTDAVAERMEGWDDMEP